MAARSEEEILEDFKEAVSISDPSADASKGPLYDFTGRPLAKILVPTEQAVDRLGRIYSAEFAMIGTEEEAEAFRNNWAEAPGLGTPSRVRVVFMRFSRPSVSETIQIPVGSIVSNQDQSLQYITIESGEINGAFADTYYNPQRRTFEITLSCIAVQNGPEYDLPAGRINTKVSQLPGIDAVESRQDATGGVAAETVQSQILRIREKLQGLAVNTPNGAYTRVRAYNPTLITDVRPVLSTNRALFRRFVTEPGTDYYIIGEQNETVNETYTSIVGGETEISLQHVPVASIDQVLLNNVPITSYYLESDTSLETGGSVLAQDKLILGSPLIAGDVLLVQVTYNSLLRQIQENIFGVTSLRKTNEIARAFRKVPLNIEVTGKALPSYSPSQVQASVQSQLQALIDTGVWQEQFLPEQVLQYLKINVPGLSSPQLLRFQRSTLATSQIEAVRLEENELAVYDEARTTVTIRST